MIGASAGRPYSAKLRVRPLGRVTVWLFRGVVDDGRDAERFRLDTELCLRPAMKLCGVNVVRSDSALT
jgi:hypothetical protein